MGKQLVVLMALASGQALAAAESGSICIAPVAKPTGGVKSLANPSGGNKIQLYKVQIDNLAPVDVSPEHGTTINELSRTQRHLLKISGDGKSVAAFHFHFADYNSHELCLWMKPLYETWSLTTATGHGKSCICH